MRISSQLIAAGIFCAALAVCALSAFFIARVVEDVSQTGVEDALAAKDYSWAEVEVNGLQVVISGTAPSEAIRFNALTTAGTVVDSARIIDNLRVQDSVILDAPKFSLEILRSDAGITMIGLIPAGEDEEALKTRLERIAARGKVESFVDSAEYPASDEWNEALEFAIMALPQLPRSKLSVEEGRLAVTAVSGSPEEKRQIESTLRRRAPAALALELDVSAPRPVITPFTLRFLIDENGARFDACSADTEVARAKIIAAAGRLGVAGEIDCTLGLGVPTPQWSGAVISSMEALAAIGAGSVTFSDADVTLIAEAGTTEADFDRIVGELEAALPDVFTLHPVLTKLPEAGDAGPPEFTATLSPEGAVQLRGRLKDERAQRVADSYAKARFGADKVYTAARLDETLADVWEVRVLAAIEALSELNSGSIHMTPDDLVISGKTGNPSARLEISRLLSSKLGETDGYEINVDYIKQLDPTLGLPSPEECIVQITAILNAKKISFEPGSATVAPESFDTLDELAELLKKCGEIPIEIGGHTDSQGREIMNLELSQSRADSVLNQLRDRRVLTATFVAKGYGETNPIADNGTEAGREQNRRIEFKLIDDKAETAETASEPSADADGTGEQQNGQN